MGTACSRMSSGRGAATSDARRRASCNAAAAAPLFPARVDADLAGSRSAPSSSSSSSSSLLLSLPSCNVASPPPPPPLLLLRIRCDAAAEGRVLSPSTAVSSAAGPPGAERVAVAAIDDGVNSPATESSRAPSDNRDAFAAGPAVDGRDTTADAANPLPRTRGGATPTPALAVAAEPVAGTEDKIGDATVTCVSPLPALLLPPPLLLVFAPRPLDAGWPFVCCCRCCCCY